MATPITFRNVAIPSFEAANRLRESSIAGIQRSLGGLANLAKSFDEESTTDNTSSILAGIKGISSLEDLDAAKQSGVFSRESIGSQFGSQVDLNATDAALSAQEGILRKSLTSGQAFDTGQAAIAAAPAIDAVRAQIAGGDFAGAGSNIGSLPVAEQAALQKSLKDARRAEDKFQGETGGLDAEQRGIVSGIQASLKFDDQAAISQFNDTFDNVVRDTPINIPETTKNTSIKQGDVISTITSDLQSLSNIDDNELEEVGGIIRRITAKGKFPGWAVQEAYRRSGGARGLFDQGGLFWNDSFSPEAMTSQLDAIMREHVQDEKNKEVIDDAKRTRDNNIQARQRSSTQALSRALAEAKRNTTKL